MTACVVARDCVFLCLHAFIISLSITAGVLRSGFRSCPLAPHRGSALTISQIPLKNLRTAFCSCRMLLLPLGTVLWSLERTCHVLQFIFSLVQIISLPRIMSTAHLRIIRGTCQGPNHLLRRAYFVNKTLGTLRTLCSLLGQVFWRVRVDLHCHPENLPLQSPASQVLQLSLEAAQIQLSLPKYPLQNPKKAEKNLVSSLLPISLQLLRGGQGPGST